MSKNTTILALGKKLTTNKTFLTNIIFTIIIFNSIQTITPNKRILQKREYKSDSIYYVSKFATNNITGTGDKFNDVAYRSMCYVKNCNTRCCIGAINKMTCGDSETCKTYEDHMYFLVAAPAALIPIVILCFLSFFVLLFTKRNDYSFCKSLLLAILCLAIISIPYVLYYARFAPKKKKKKEKK